MVPRMGIKKKPPASLGYMEQCAQPLAGCAVASNHGRRCPGEPAHVSSLPPEVQNLLHCLVVYLLKLFFQLCGGVSGIQGNAEI